MLLRETLLKHAKIVSLLNQKRNKGATYQEIKNHLLNEFDEEPLSFSKRTFDRDKKDIEEIYGIEIIYESKVYKIKSVDELADQSVTRLLEDFHVFQAFGSTKTKPDFVHFESRKPTNVAYFERLMNAIEKSQKLQILYHKFDTGNVFERMLEPYALKEFKNRWYLIARDTHDQRLKTYALDRINKVTALQEYFTKDEKVDIEQLYAHCFGIIMPNDEQTLETVVLSFDAHQGKYIKSLPLHPYQRVIVDNEEELRIELEVYITYDFILEVLSHGDRVTVLAPQSLIDNEIKWRIVEMAKKY